MLDMSHLLFISNADASFPHWILAAAITLTVLDVFICTEWLTWLSLLAFAAWGTWSLDVPPQWSAFLFLVFLGIGIAFYFLFWRSILRRAISETFLRSATDEQINSMVGRSATVISTGDSACIRVQDEIYPLADACRANLHAGDRVVITAFESGVATVTQEKTNA